MDAKRARRSATHEVCSAPAARRHDLPRAPGGHCSSWSCTCRRGHHHARGTSDGHEPAGRRTGAPAPVAPTNGQLVNATWTFGTPLSALAFPNIRPFSAVSCERRTIIHEGNFEVIRHKGFSTHLTQTSGNPVEAYCADP